MSERGAKVNVELEVGLKNKCLRQPLLKVHGTLCLGRGLRQGPLLGVGGRTKGDEGRDLQSAPQAVLGLCFQ